MTTGVMQEIREKLSAGHSSGEVIAEGYAPPTVYKVQRQLRHAAVSPAAASIAATAASAARVQELETEVRDLEDLVASLEEESAELAVASEQLADAKSKVTELESARADAVRRGDAVDAQLRQAAVRIRDLESGAEEALRLRHTVAELRTKLNQAASGEARLRQDSDSWRQQFNAERAARLKAAQQRAAWEGQARRLERQNDALEQTVSELEPLRVWAGHPCKVCRKPMAGAVARQSAAKVMEEFGHKNCLEQNSGSPLALVAAVAGVYGLSKLR